MKNLIPVLIAILFVNLVSAQDTFLVKGKLIFIDTTICNQGSFLPNKLKLLLVFTEKNPNICKQVVVFNWFTSCESSLKVNRRYLFQLRREPKTEKRELNLPRTFICDDYILKDDWDYRFTVLKATKLMH